MSEVNINYKGNKIAGMDASGTKTLLTSGKYCEGDISVEYTQPAPTLQTKTRHYTPSATAQSELVTADIGYDGLDSVDIAVAAISPQRTSADATVYEDQVSVPNGWYPTAFIKTVASGSAKPASSISATGATITTGTNTLTLSKSVSNNPQVTEGYVFSGTAGNSSVSLTATVTTKAAATYTPSTSTQTISANQYLTGAQTINPIPSQYIVPSGSQTLTSNDTYDVTSLASVTVAIPIVTYYTGTGNPASSTGSNGDIYLKVVS